MQTANVSPFSIDPETDTICNVIRNWAEHQPEALAILSKSHAPITYGSLVEQIHRIRECIHSCGFGRGDRIAILHSGGVDMALLLLGIAACATAVPVNPNFTAEELRSDFRRRNVHALVLDSLVETPARKVAAQLGIPIMEATRSSAEADNCLFLSGGAPQRSFDSAPVTADDYFLILSTSGTTGTAKSTPLRHRHRIPREDRAKPSDRHYIAGHLYYAGRLMGVLRCLMSGASFVLAPSFDLDDFWHFLGNSGLTEFSANPTICKSLLGQAEKHQAEIKQSALHHIYSVTDKLDPETARAMEAAFGVPILERYAMTEVNRITDNPPPPGIAKRGTVGIPTGCQVAIRASEGRFLGAGI